MPQETVIYVPGDFMIRHQLDSLFEHSYQSDLLPLFAWDAYLSAEAVGLTLAFIHRHALPGSIVVFDYATARSPDRQPDTR